MVMNFSLSFEDFCKEFEEETEELNPEEIELPTGNEIDFRLFRLPDFDGLDLELSD